jgi:hypothetical protein
VENIVNKFLCRSALVCLMATSLATVASANGGSAVLTFWRAHHNTTTGRDIHTLVSVSNPSQRDVEVTLRLYDQNGNAIGTPGFLIPVGGGGAFTGCNATGNVCTLTAGKTGVFVVGNTLGNHDGQGYGILEWSSSSPDSSPTALIAGGSIAYLEVGGPQTRVPVVITRDQPF